MTPREYNNQFSDEELTNEIWEDVPDYEGYYQVSNLGRVKGVDRYVNSPHGLRRIKEKILVPILGTNKRFFVNLSKENKKLTTHYLHRLVLIVFIGKLIKNMEACHNDGNKQNNRLSNLRWDTHKNNEADRVKHGTAPRGENQGKHKLWKKDIPLIKKLYASGDYSQQDIANMFGVAQSTIGRVIREVSWCYEK